MTNLSYDFSGLAATDKSEKPDQQKKPTPFSLRLSFEERARLERDAAGMSLGAYIRERLFGEDAAPRKTRGKFPVKGSAPRSGVNCSPAGC